MNVRENISANWFFFLTSHETKLHDPIAFGWAVQETWDKELGLWRTWALCSKEENIHSCSFQTLFTTDTDLSKGKRNPSCYCIWGQIQWLSFLGIVCRKGWLWGSAGCWMYSVINATIWYLKSLLFSLCPMSVSSWVAIHVVIVPLKENTLLAWACSGPGLLWRSVVNCYLLNPGWRRWWGSGGGGLQVEGGWRMWWWEDGVVQHGVLDRN